MAVHVLLGLLTIALSLFSVIDRMKQGFSFNQVKHNVGMTSFVCIGLLLLSGMSLSMLKAVNKSVSSVTINAVRIFHTVSHCSKLALWTLHHGGCSLCYENRTRSH